MFHLLLALLFVFAASPADGRTDVGDDLQAGRSWLHSFEYERALEAFVRAERSDPRTPMAYWGQAMCYEQLLWGNEDVNQARAILARLRRSGALQRATPLERGWLATLEPLFGEGDRVSRLVAYAQAMEKLAAAFPADSDVAAFHGLALMATRSRGLAGAHPSTGASTTLLAGHGMEIEQPQLAGSPEQTRATEIFARILQSHPAHPGALHYVIHAWDDPVNAHKALEHAKLYARVVPASSHARHMPAHVFVQLGMWKEAIASDEAASAAADARVARAGLPITATDFHPLSWLVYEYAQEGRLDDARRTVERLRRPAEETRDPRLLSLVGTLRSRIAVEARTWNDLRGPAFVNYDELFAVGYGAAHRGDLSLAEQARLRLGEMAATPRYADRRKVLEIMALQVGAAIRAQSGDRDGALALLRDATAAERALPAPIGPPALIKPAQEQYAEVLLDAGRPQEAVAQFDGALERLRLRRLSVEGRARAAEAASSRGSGSGSSPVSSTRGRRTSIGAAIAVILVLAVRRMRQRRR